MKKLPAFTLMELLIGMIISSIVIGFGYATYALIYKQYLNYKSVKEQLVETVQLHAALSTDLRYSELISFRDDKLTFYPKNAPELTYRFYDDWITRTDRELTDTFHIAVTDIRKQFIFPDNELFVKQFSFEATTLKEKEYFNFVKNYSSETLMNYKALLQTNP